MRFKSFQHFEEKFVFNFSKGFWRTVVVLSVLAVIASIIILIYSFIPPGKANVVKAAYPPADSVTIADVQLFLTESKKSGSEVSQFLPDFSGEEVNDSAYQSELAELRKLLPPERFSWKTSGYWYYPYGERYYTYYKSERYREWRVSNYGIQELLDNKFKQISLYDPDAKANLIRNYNAVIKQFEIDKRRSILTSLLNISKSNLNTSVNNIITSAASIKLFPLETVDAYNGICAFINANPNDGLNLISYINSIIPNFSENIRISVLNQLLFMYRYRFNNRVEYQKELTQFFIPLIPKIPDQEMVEYLDAFYEVALSKDIVRQQQINLINVRYQDDLNNAEFDYLAAIAEKNSLKSSGSLIFVYSAATIISVAIILLLFSIQLYLRKIHSQLETSPVSNT